ncbi:hypothetical protein M0805_008336 [Coniferiporia weirii]|nr:hypothetical protein M0805_008336 [Coniferiporia weirii]
MSPQKRTASQACLPNRQSNKIPRTMMTRSDTEKDVNSSASQGPGLLARWKELIKDTFVAPFTSHPGDELPTFSTETSHSLHQKHSAERASVQPKPQLTRTNTHNPTNLLASSSSSSSSFRLPTSIPLSTSVSTIDISRLSLSGSPSTQTSSFNSPPTSTCTFDVPQLDVVQKLLSQTKSGRLLDSGVRKSYKKRQHIYEKQHKEHVKEALERQFYELKRGKGYEADFETFRGYCHYLRRLDRLEEQRRVRVRKGAQAPILPPDDVDYLKRAMEKAAKSLHSPRPPKPFSPTIEQLNAYTRARDEQIRDRLHPKRKPVPERLPKGAQEEVDILLRKEGVVSKVGREQVSHTDLRRLRPGVWLNDEIINFYGQLINDRAAEADAAKENKQSGAKRALNVHYFSTFFWSKLQMGYEKGRLAKWTKKLDIFSKDIILIAVNHNNAHWTSAAINFRQKRIESYDSMGYARQEVFAALRSYLDDEHRNKKKKPFDFSGWTNHEVENYPEQENGYDCGVFTCQTLEYLSRGEDTFNFTQRDMTYFRQRMIWEIGRAKLADPA